MELKRYLDILRRWWWPIALGVVLALVGSLVVSQQTTPTYRASTRLLVNQVQIPGLDTYQGALTSERLKTYSELLRGRPIVTETIKQLDLPLTVEELSRRITVRTIASTQLLELSVEDTDPARAAAIANRLTDVFIAQNRTLQAGGTEGIRRQVEQELASLDQKIKDTDRRFNQLRATPGTGGDSTAEATRLQGELTQYLDLYFRLLELQQRITLSQTQATSSITIAEPATVPAQPVRPKTVQNAILAGVVGLMLTIGLTMLIEYLDDRVRDPEELRQRLGLVPLSILRLNRNGPLRLLSEAKLGRHEHFAEALRLLRTNLEFVTMGHQRVVAITSAIADEGKSTVAANLALAEAQAGKRVVLIDADLRKPVVHRLFNLKNYQGLSTFLAQAQTDVAAVLQPGPLGIQLLTSGPIPPNPAELLGSQRMAELIADLRTRADVIILDSVPILPVADTLVLQRHVDGVVLVMDIGRTGLRTLHQALLSLQGASANVLGVVLNKDKQRRGSYYYGYRHQKGQAPAGDEPDPNGDKRFPPAITSLEGSRGQGTMR